MLPLPVGRLSGVGKVTGEKLGKLGVVTVADLGKLDSYALEHEFGRYGLRLYELERGIDETRKRELQTIVSDSEDRLDSKELDACSMT